MKPVIAILLSAGVGARMGSLTKDKTKSLLEVNGRPIIAYMIDFVKKISSERIVVVGGHCFQGLQKVVNDIDPEVLIVENTDYQKQNLVSFDAALAKCTNTSVLVCNTDYIFEDATAEKVKQNLREISVYCSFDLSSNDDDVMRVQSDGGGKLVAMSKQLTEFNAVYTGIFFIEDKHIPLVKNIIGGIFKKYGKAEATVEYIFRELVSQGHTVNVCDVGEANWVEIDTPEELELARKKFE